VPQCEDGTALHSTVTGSGFVGVTGDPTFDALQEEVFNNTYNLTRDCCNGGSWDGSTCDYVGKWSTSNSDYEAWVTFPSILAGRQATIQLRFMPAPAFSVTATRTDGPYSSSAALCSVTVYDCDEAASGIPTSSSLGLDVSGADITTT
jgi:hypothetical protein